MLGQHVTDGEAQSASSNTQAAPKPLAQKQPAPDKKLQGRILLVEDNLVNQKVAKRLLEKLGCEVTVADNGLLALEAVKQDSFELIFMDVQMPEMDGFEATKQIRKLQQSEAIQTPIVAMTAHAMMGDKERCLDSGMDDYLTKPIKIDTLHAMLNKWLNEQELQNA